MPVRLTYARLIINSALAAASLLVSGVSAAQTMVFQALTTEDGLSQSTVNATLQDTQGYLWLATENGLNRYDGYTVQRYMRDPGNPHALASDFIWSMAQDNKGDLWLATEGAGLVHWDRSTEHFRTVLDDRDQAARRLARRVFIDAAGQIWMGTRGAGLLQMDATGRELAQYLHEADNPQSLNDNAVSAIIQDGAERLLIGTDAGLAHLDTKTLHYSRWRLPNTQLGKQPAVSSLLRDQHGRLWVGTYEHGVFVQQYPEDAPEQWVHYSSTPNSADGLSSNEVRDILEDSAGRIWVATQDGLNLYETHSGQFRSFRHSDSDRYSLTDNRLMSLHEDAHGLLWIGTRIGGVNRWNPRSWTLGAFAPAAMSGAAVLAFAQDIQKRIWVGGPGMPLLQMDNYGTVVDSFDPAHGYPDRGDAPVTALLNSRGGRLWIGTMGAGIQIWRPGESQLLSVQHDPDRPDSLGADGIMSLYEDRDAQIWAGTFGGGLARINPQTLQVTRYASDPAIANSLSSPRATSIVQGPRGRMWVGTDGGGLNVLDVSNGSFRSFRHDPENPQSLGSDTIYALHADSHGDLWIGTAGAGLAHLRANQMDVDYPVFEHHSTSTGLSSNVINGIQPDVQGNLWLSTNNGIVRYKPSSGEISQFHRGQGLQSEEYNFGAHYRARDGRLFFGAAGGYNAFYPQAVEINRKAPQIVLTAFEKLNEPVKTAEPLAALHNITLQHNDDVVTFEYAALDFTAPEQNLYSVQLQGFDRDWTPASTRHRSTYTNLDPGHYVFRVRAANSDGVWSETPLEIALRVKAAPWATPYAYAAYLLLIASLITLFFRRRLKALEREARINQLAYYDQITGLPNRELFEIRAAAALVDAQAHGEQLAVICLRIGPLKRIHDSLGYRSIDDLLRTVSQRLNFAFFGAGDAAMSRQLGRLSDDIFVAFVQVRDAEPAGASWARRLGNAVSAPLTFGEHLVNIPSFAGIACYPQHGEDAATLIEFADTAASDATLGKNASFAYYDRSMTDRALDRLALESDLRRAIETDGLELNLQGKFAANGELIGAEALTRWHHPSRGAVSPALFVPLAEESELIMDLDDWVVHQAAKTLQNWQNSPRAALSIAVNVSAETFTTGRIFDILENCRALYQIDPARLEIEITESVLASDLDLITSALKRIKGLGHSLSLDDFGTGYSSLTYLQHFPIDKLKIDQAFVRDLENQPDQISLCTAIIALARSMKLQTIAEGVESQAQLDLLVKLGCDQMQGYFLHRPEPAVAFALSGP